MKCLRSIEIQECSKEEVLPGFTRDFPYLATCAELDRYVGAQAPWHWHKTVELFYMQSGTLEYTTAKGKLIFPEGSGGFINANILHTSRVVSSCDRTIQLLHQFDPLLLSGGHGSQIENKYILPLTTAPGVEIIPLYRENSLQAELLEEIKRAFELSEREFGYEFKLREILSSIWLKLLAQVPSFTEQGSIRRESDDKIKVLMVYIHEHFHETISVDRLAQVVHISKRACFRLFQETLHMTPMEYIRSCRLQKAGQMLAESDLSVTQIADSCGLGSSSYFGKVFREEFGCPPLAYRKQWHDRDKNRHQ